MANQNLTSEEINCIIKEHKILVGAIENAPVPFAIYDDEDNLMVWSPHYESIHPDVFHNYDKEKSARLKYEDVIRITESKRLSGAELEAHITERVKLQRSDKVTTSTRKYANDEWHKITKYITDDNAVCGFATNINELKLKEAEIKEALKVAEAAELAKSEFLANMSHEIRTPMNGVMGMAELLSTTELDAKQTMFTDVIMKSGASLLTIINDILDFSKIDAGQMELASEPFRLAEAIEDVATLVSSKVAEKDLELIVRVAPGLPDMLEGDVGRLRQVITNLLGNAVKFTEQGHVYVNVEGLITRKQEKEYARLKFSIQDTGIGIPEEESEKIFQKFSQVDASATRKHEGTGLGLSISSSLIKLMGGEITVESELGHGSTFSFEIELPVHGKVVRQPVIPTDITNVRVLIIDDNNVNRSILSEQMASWNFDSAATSTGQEGLELMKITSGLGVNIDVVILDYQMPEMDGAEVLRIMRDDEKMKNIPVIMLSSVDSPEVNMKLSELRVEAHLTKPARSSFLLETIKQVVSENRMKMKKTTSSNLASSTIIESAKVLDMENADESNKNPLIAVTPKEYDVLVAEDNEVNQIVVRQILDQTGLSYKVVENGRLAAAAYKVEQPKVILMDVSMPQMNGIEATTAIRKYEHENTLTRTPIVALTAHALKGDAEKCFKVGMDDYLSKPVSPKQLKSTIEKWLSANKMLEAC